MATPTSSSTPTPTPTISKSQIVPPGITQASTRTPTKSVTQTPTKTQTQTHNVEPTPGITLAPTRTPTKTKTQTPTNSQTARPTGTPTKTPKSTSTQTPTISLTKTNTPTNTITSSITKTNTPTVTVTPTQVGNSSILIAGMSGSTKSVFKYNFNSNILFNLGISWVSVGQNKTGLAHSYSSNTSTGYIWTKYTNQNLIDEYIIFDSNYNNDFNRVITLTGTGYGYGLTYKDDNTLITTRTSGATKWVVEININPLLSNPIDTFKFQIPYGQTDSDGDLMYTNTGKFIWTSNGSLGGIVEQYNYITGQLEFRHTACCIPSSLWQYNNGIYSSQGAANQRVRYDLVSAIHNFVCPPIECGPTSYENPLACIFSPPCSVNFLSLAGSSLLSNNTAEFVPNITPITVNLNTTFSSGSIQISYDLISDNPVIEDLTVSFTNTLGVYVGTPIQIITGVTINSGQTEGKLTIILNDNFNNLDYTSIISGITVSPPYLSGSTTVTTNNIFPTKTKTPTPTKTPTHTVKVGLTRTPTNTATSTPKSSPKPTRTPTHTPSSNFISGATPTPSVTVTYTRTQKASDPTRTPTKTSTNNFIIGTQTPTSTVTYSKTSVNSTPSKTPTNTPTRTQTITPTTSLSTSIATTTTPSKTPTRTKTSTPTSSITPTSPTNTPTRTVTPTRCCSEWELYGGYLSTGSTFSITTCNNTVYLLDLDRFTTTGVCAFNVVMLTSNGGNTYALPGCTCNFPAPIVGECSVLYVTVDNLVYSYNVTANTSTLLSVPNVQYHVDIAHTNNKLWINGNQQVQEWDITLSPFSAIYNGEKGVSIFLGNGITAIDDTTLIAVNISNYPNYSIVELDMSQSVPSVTTKFYLPEGYVVSGDMVLTTDGKLLVTTSFTPNTYILQYDYASGFLEFSRTLNPIIEQPWGVFENNSEIYITDAYQGNIVHVQNTYPYTLTITGSTPQNVYGASQIPSCTNTSFQPVNANLYSNVSSGSTILDYTLEISVPLDEDITLSFTNILGKNDSSFIIINTGVTINSGQTIGNTSITLPNDYSSLNLTSSFSGLTIVSDLSGYIVVSATTTTFGPTSSPTPTPTTTPTPTPTNTLICPYVVGTTNTSYILSPQVSYNFDELIQSDVYYGYQYYMTIDDTYVFDSGGTYVNNIGRPIQTQVFDTTLFKYYGSYADSGSGKTRIYDVDLNLTTQIILSGCPDPNSSTYNSLASKVGILDTYTDKIAIIDSTSETLDGYIDLPSGAGYKGIIESDSLKGNMYVINAQPGSNNIIMVNPSTLTIEMTIPFTADTQVTSMTFNPTNGYMYILQNNGNLRWIDNTSNYFVGSINLSYSGTYHTMTYDINKDYLYVSNLQDNSVQNIIVFNCSNNTELKQVNSVQINNGQGVVNYNPTTSLIWYSSVGSDELIWLCT